MAIYLAILANVVILRKNLELLLLLQPLQMLSTATTTAVSLQFIYVGRYRIVGS